MCPFVCPLSVCLPALVPSQRQMFLVASSALTLLNKISSVFPCWISNFKRTMTVFLYSKTTWHTDDRFLDAATHLYKRSCPSDRPTMGQNQVILRHQKFTFPRAREWAKWASERCEQTSERTSEWPSTYVSILVCSRPQCVLTTRIL